MPDTFVFIIVAHFTVMGYGGDALPEAARDRKSYSTEASCTKALPAVQRAFARSSLPVQPDFVACLKMEIVK
jgi:hypothetical protein